MHGVEMCLVVDLDFRHGFNIETILHISHRLHQNPVAHGLEIFGAFFQGPAAGGAAPAHVVHSAGC